MPVASTRLRLVDVPVAPTRVTSIDLPSSGLRWARRYRDKLRLTDLSIILAAVASADAVSFLARAPGANTFTVLTESVILSAVFTIAWFTTLAGFHTRDSHIVGSGVLEYKRVVNASALAFGFLAVGFVVFKVGEGRGFFIIAFPLGVIGLVLDRWLWRKWLLNQRKFGHYLSRTIVVGTRDEVAYVIAQIETKTAAVYHVVGAALEENSSGYLDVGNLRVPIVANLEGIVAGAESVAADTVIVAGQPSGGSQFIQNLGWDLEGIAAQLVLSSRLTDIAGPRIRFRPVEGLPLIHVEIPSFEGGKHLLKRTVDVILSSVALVVLLPLMLIIGIAIRIDSDGPALFRQERCGRNGYTFQMFKFRSMVRTAESDLAGLLEKNQGSGVLFKLHNDPRVTRLGRILRKYSLDELPQIWNVLIGDMSVVGPRPPLNSEVKCYEGNAHRRLFIKPGITGLWQISGRSDLGWDESIRLDLYYVENWSLTGDAMIIWRTLRTVVRPTGAY